MTEETLFHEALAKSSGERAAFLDAACADQPQLRAAIEALLAAHEASGNLLDRPPAKQGETIDAEPGLARPTVTGEYTPDPVVTSLEGAATEYQQQVTPGGIIAGRYTLVEKIGEGGMGEVWVANQTEPVKRQVALKLIKTGMDSKAVLARFDQERQALAMMDHPNIARVLDGGMTPTGQPFFVMELVNGLSLTRFCDEATLTPRQRLDLFVPICQAVQHAHQKGIVHRDLKPSNILVTVVDGKGVPKVIDFGVAKATRGKVTDESLSTQLGAIIGTLEYMSPEQAGFSGEDIDTRADIYSLGVILYELLTGLRPIDARRLKKAVLTELIRIIREEEPSKPSTRLSTDESLPSQAALRQTEPRKLMAMLRGELDWVVMKCLEKQRDRRYETSSGLARDIQRYLADEPVEARPPSASYRLGKFLKRHRAPVLAAALVFLALLAGVIGTTWGLIEAMHQEELAREETAEKERARAAEALERGRAQTNEKRAIDAAEAARKAKERESQQRARAVKARNRTREALDAMTSSVTGDSLDTQKEISPEQKKFLREVLNYYKEFASEQADDEESRFRTAYATWRVALIEARLGRMKEAEAAFRLARDRYEQLVADFPNEPDYRQALATNHNNVGLSLMALGKWPDAEQHYLKALSIQKKLAADFHTDPAHRQALAWTHNNLAILLYYLGKYPDAEGQYRQALGIKGKLAAEFRDVPRYQHELAGTHINLGSLLIDLRKGPQAEEQLRRAQAILEELVARYREAPEHSLYLARTHISLGHLLADVTKRPGAEQEYQRAISIMEKLVARFPSVAAYRRELAASHNGMGLRLADQGKWPQAEQEYQQALAHREQLAAKFPTVAEHQIELGGSYCNMGYAISAKGQPGDSLVWFEKAIRKLTAVYEQDRRQVTAKQFLRNSYMRRAWAYHLLQKYAEAVEDWERAIDLTPPRDRPGLRGDRAVALAKAGRLAEAFVEIAELSKAPNANENALYNFACVYALASDKSTNRKAEYADQAMVLLQRAVKAGYKDAAHMARDTDLDPLRARDDFKKLITELMRKAPARPDRQ